MAIVYRPETQQFYLHTDHSTYVIELLDGRIPMHAYWGKPLREMPSMRTFNSVSDSIFLSWDTGLSTESRFRTTGILPLELPMAGSGDYREAALHVQFADGSRVNRLYYASHTIAPGKPELPGLPATFGTPDEVDTLTLTLRDDLTGLTVDLLYSVFPARDAIVRSVRVKNDTKDPVRILKIASASVDFYDPDLEMIHLPGMWARERQIERKPIIHGIQKFDSKRGASSHFQNPFFALVNPSTTEDAGDAYGFNLVYSGNFAVAVEEDTFEMVRANIGLNDFDFSWLLEKGEQFQSPEAVLIYSGAGLGEMSRQYHRLCRQNLCRSKYAQTERPVLINNWEGTYFDFTEEKLLAIAETAKKMDIDLMVLDDGWFGERNSDKGFMGDWICSTKKLPHGLKGLGESINRIGMKFGLWFEPEVVSTDSHLYEQHPDWCLHVAGRPRTEHRNELLLDFSRPEVCDYIIDTLSAILSDAPISYVKWDMNRNFSEAGSAALPPERQQEVPHRYILGLYHVMDVLTRRFPDILFEGCSGGGGRFDPGMLYYMPQIWTSDDTDAEERLYIQHGTSLAYPTCAMGSHVSVCPNHQTGRSTPFAMRGNVAMAGQFGYELDPTKMSEEDLAAAREQVAFYKKYRRIVQQGDMYRLVSPFEEPFAAWEFLSPAGDMALLYTFVVASKPTVSPKRVKMQGLDPDAVYVEESSGQAFSGAFLMQVGVPRERDKDHLSEIAVFRRQA